MPNTSASYSGALELSWTNKHLRLLAAADGAYQLVAGNKVALRRRRLRIYR